MTIAPRHLLQLREWLEENLEISAGNIGIVGNAEHKGGYHCGSDRVITGDYSVNESARDKNGLSIAASAIDIPQFKNRYGNLAGLSKWLVEKCKQGDSRTKGIREIIYSPDGKIVRRWDKLGIRKYGDDSHLWHTHISQFRDSSDNLVKLFEGYLEEMAATPRDFWKYDPGKDGEGGVMNPPQRSDSKTNITVEPGFALGETFRLAIDEERQLNKIDLELIEIKETLNKILISLRL